MHENAADQVSDEELKKSIIISSSPVHEPPIREAQEPGATTMALMNVSGADPHGAIEGVRRSVLRAVGAVASR